MNCPIDFVIDSDSDIRHSHTAHQRASHTGLATRLRPSCDHKMLQSWANRTKSVRQVAEVVGHRHSKISRSKVDVQNFLPAIPNRKRSQTGLTRSYHQSCMIAPPVVDDRCSHSRTIGRATGLAT